MTSPVRVRFAPSPTGYLHVGGARTALFNYLFAKNQKGSFILRIEDTDQARSTDEALKMQMQDLMWLGLNWDEGPDPVTLEDRGEFGPYRQSRRLDVYRKYADELLASGKAFYCFCTDEELEAKREQALKEGRQPHYDGTHRNLDLAEAKKRIVAGDKATVRFKVPVKDQYVLDDIVRGEVRFPGDQVGDFVLLRSDGMPVYNFCCVIDDYLMQISHVLRGEDHLLNSVRQMMLYEAFGWKLPGFAHMSTILGPDKQKLSKRHGATSCSEYKEKGFLPEAVKNFIALLGWSHPEGKETFDAQEMENQFSLNRLNPAPAVFDDTKLKWVNAQHLRQLPDGELWKVVSPLLDQQGLELPQDPDWQQQAVVAFKPYMETLADAQVMFSLIPNSCFSISDEGKEVLSQEGSRQVIEAWRNGLRQISSERLSSQEFNDIQGGIKNDLKVKGKKLFFPIRVAVIGRPHGTDLATLTPLIPCKDLLERADICLRA